MHKLFARQLAKATAPTGNVDIDRLAELVGGAYDEMGRDQERTDRSIKLMIEELTVAHQQLADAFEAIPEGIALLDADDRYIMWNENFVKLYDRAKPAIKVGARFEDVLREGLKYGQNPDAEGREEEWISERMAQHRLPLSVHDQQLSGNRWVRIEERRTASGGSVGVRIDITELKRREESFRQMLHQLDVALENMSHGLCMFDADGRVTVFNERFANLMNIPIHVLKGGSLLEMFRYRKSIGSMDDDPEKLFLQIQREMANGHRISRIVEWPDGRIFRILDQPIANGGWVGTIEDITELRRAELEISHLGRHDALTDLPNRAFYREKLNEALAKVARGERAVIFCLDLDHFKDVNDTLGHPIGDELLVAVAQRLRECVRESDTVARLGGDEFAIVQLGGAERVEDIERIARRLIEAISTPYRLNGHDVVVGVSVGISVSPDDGSDPDQLLRNADMALYRAKGDGRGTYRFFEAEMDARAQARRAMELDLRAALIRGEFEPYFQPIYDLDQNEIIAFEALLRWHHPVKGLVPPMQFIPLAEETGLIVPIGEWMLRKACDIAASWPTPIRVAINLSPVQFKSRNLLPAIINALSTSQLTPERLELEITETVLLDNNEANIKILHALRDLGVKISMDDFGTGYCSLSYLRSFPFDKIKIDRSFLQDLTSRADSSAIVRAVSGIGKSLGIVTTAEGVETEEQLAFVRSEGCNQVQGYFFSEPLPEKQAVALLKKSRAGRAVA